MTARQFQRLREGDCIQSRLTGQHYLVTGNYGDVVLAVQVVHATHPDEWDIVYTVTEIAATAPRGSQRRRRDGDSSP
jgi:hypothetical protein